MRTERQTRASYAGPALVALGAFLWATDALFRFPTTARIDPVLMVWFEHAVVLALLLPWVLAFHRRKLFTLTARDWLSAILIGAGGSAVATVFFTESFRYLNPSITILLQKLQPVLVVIAARVALGERPGPRFYRWAPVALAAACMMSLGDFTFEGMRVHSRGILYALSAAALWAVATVGGKSLLEGHSISVTTFWRFAFGLLALSVMLAVGQSPVPWALLSEGQNLRPLLYIALVPGLVAMITYYAGMARTSASVTTFAELTFPVSAVILNTVFLHLPLTPIELAAGAVLVLAVIRLSGGTPASSSVRD